METKLKEKVLILVIITMLITITLLTININYNFAQIDLLPDGGKDTIREEDDVKKPNTASHNQNRYFNVSLKHTFYISQQTQIRELVSQYPDIKYLKHYQNAINSYVTNIESLKSHIEKNLDSSSKAEIDNMIAQLRTRLQGKIRREMSSSYSNMIEDGKADYINLVKEMKEKLPAACPSCKISNGDDYLMIRVFDQIWFDPGKTYLKKESHKALEQIADTFIVNNTRNALGMMIKSHTDSDGIQDRYKWYREISTWRMATDDVRKNTALDLLDDSGKIAQFKYYYQYRLIPSVPNGSSMVVLYNEAYEHNLDYNMELSRTRAENVDKYMREANEAYDVHQFEVKYIGAAFLEPIVQNHPVNYRSYADAKEYKQKKVLNNRIELVFYVSYKRIITILNQQEWGMLKEYLREIY